jgi:arabinogalactan oligomer/maltooligosaccharide transport system substrate-binding protein
MLAMAAEITAANPEVYGFGLIANFYANAGYLFGFGGHIFKGDSATPVPEGEETLSGFNTPEVAAFLTFLKKVRDSPGVFTQADQGAVESLFREGKAAMMINGPWFQGAAVESIGAENVGVALLPAISELGDAPAKPFVGIQSFYINANLDEEQAALAVEFAKWMSTAGVQPFVDQAGYLPAANSVTLPAENPHAAVFVEQYAAGVPLSSNPKMAAVWTPAGDMITKALEGTLPPEQAAAEAAETIDQAG